MDDDKFYVEDQMVDDFYTEREKRLLDSLDSETEREQFRASIAETRQAFREVLSTEAGQRVLWSILGSANIYASTFSPNSWQAFNEGRRALGLEIVEQIVESSPESWLNMQAKYLNIQSFKLNK